MRRSVSIFGPKAFSMRNAISPDRSAFPLSRLDRVGREMPSASAAAVTERPSGSIISVRMNSPGCGGFSIRVGVSFSVVVFIIHIDNFVVVVYAECHPPVLGHLQAPRVLAVADEKVRFPD